MIFTTAMFINIESKQKSMVNTCIIVFYEEVCSLHAASITQIHKILYNVKTLEYQGFLFLLVSSDFRYFSRKSLNRSQLSSSFQTSE